MKLFNYIGAGLLVMGFTACDNIDEDDRFIPVERPHSEKTVLIEEFTGARCVNCPDGAAVVAALHETYGDNVIAVSHYPSQMESLTLPLGIDLRTSLASDYFAAYNGPNRGLPSAMFNRTAYNGQTLILQPTTWGSVVYDMLMNNESPVLIKMDSRYDASTRKLDVDYDVQFIDAVPEDVSFQLWIVENGIISPQLSTTGLIPQYENNHVLRGALNGTWGEAKGGAHMAGSTVTGSGSIVLADNWKPENCQVVGFLYRTSGRQVVQAGLVKSILPVASEE